MNLIRQLNSDSFHNFLKLKLMTTRIPTPRKPMTTCFQPFTVKKKNSEWTLNKFPTLLFLLPHITGYSFVTFMISARCTGGPLWNVRAVTYFLEMQFDKRQRQ